VIFIKISAHSKSDNIGGVSSSVANQAYRFLFSDNTG